MNDQVTPAVEGRRRSAAPWLILALVVILAAVGVWFLTAKRVPEGDPAGFLPKDCMMAMTFDFTSSPDKQAALDVVEGIFKDAGIDDMEAFLFKQMSKGLRWMSRGTSCRSSAERRVSRCCRLWSG